MDVFRMMKKARPGGKTAAVIVVLLLALGVRAGVAVVRFDELGGDPDGYVDIARNLVAGRGYAVEDRGWKIGDRPADSRPKARPTAYRPPLYPLLLAAVLAVGGGTVLLAVVHAVLGTLTVLLTYLLGRRLAPGLPAVFAAGLVAVDPLLVRYTALPMTETLATFLATLLLATLLLVSTRRQKEPARVGPDRASTPRLSTRAPLPIRAAAVGAVFGSCALCRPTIWAFGALAALAVTIRCCRFAAAPKDGAVPAGRRLNSSAWSMVIGAMVVVSPWLIRNLHVFGSPILTTTHGGYTLLLGNNPMFYREVVAAPLGTTWDAAPADRSQQAWLRSVRREMHRDLGTQADDEVAADRWMYRRALENIAAEPAMFLKACGLRFLRFWNLVPLRPARSSLPRPVLWAVGLFYGAVFVVFAVGLGRIVLEKRGGWLFPLLLIASFCLVHLFYWSNARMRAPVTPVIALVAVAGVSRRIVGRSGPPLAAGREDA